MSLATHLPAALLLLPLLLFDSGRGVDPGSLPGWSQQSHPPHARADRSVCGALSTDRVLRETTEPYVLCARGASVTGGATLRIEPGVTLLAEPGARLRIRSDGALRAIGTGAQPIRIIGADPTPGSWSGIWHESGSDENELAWVEIAHGGASTYANLYVAQSARVRIRNSVFRDSGTWGVHVASSGADLPDFHANHFLRNERSGLRIFADQMRRIDDESTFAGNGHDFIEVRQGTLAGEPHLWGRTAVPFLLTGYVNVSTNLEVGPGFHLLAAEGAGGIRIRTDGSIRAIGTATDPIRFTAESGAAGAWSGFWIESDAGNELRFVEIAHGGRGSGFHNVLLGSGGAVAVTSSIIRESAAFGINVSSRTATLTQTGNFFRANVSGDIQTPEEVLAMGGIPPFHEAVGTAQHETDTSPDPGRLQAHERLSVLPSGIRAAQELIDAGYSSAADIADQPEEAFREPAVTPAEPATIGTQPLIATGIRFEAPRIDPRPVAGRRLIQTPAFDSPDIDPGALPRLADVVSAPFTFHVPVGLRSAHETVSEAAVVCEASVIAPGEGRVALGSTPIPFDPATGDFEGTLVVHARGIDSPPYPVEDANHYKCRIMVRVDGEWHGMADDAEVIGARRVEPGRAELIGTMF